MKILSIQGKDHELRRKVISVLSSELKRLRYGVALFRLNEDIDFEFDVNSMVIRSENRTGIAWNRNKSISEMLPFIKEDFLLVEGEMDNIPNIVCSSEADIDVHSKLTLGYVSSKEITTITDKPVFFLKSNKIELVDYIVENTPNTLPFLERTPCCKRCGYDDCIELLEQIIEGNNSEKDCVLNKDIVDVKIDGNSLPMVEFVQDVIKTTICSLLGTLDGYDGKSKIEITIEENNTQR